MSSLPAADAADAHASSMHTGPLDLLALSEEESEEEEEEGTSAAALLDAEPAAGTPSHNAAGSSSAHAALQPPLNEVPLITLICPDNLRADRLMSVC